MYPSGRDIDIIYYRNIDKSRAKFVLFISVYNNINFVTVYIPYLIIIICNILLVFITYRPNKYVCVYVYVKTDKIIKTFKDIKIFKNRLKI